MAVIFFNLVVVAHAWPGKADELPANHVRVTTVHGIAEHAFDGVLAEEREEKGGLNLLQGFVLPGGREEVKTHEIFQAVAVDLPRSFFSLIAELVCSIFERGLRVAKSIATVGAGELSIDIDRNTGFASAGAGVVGRENARGRGSDDESFFFGEKAERDADWFPL